MAKRKVSKHSVIAKYDKNMPEQLFVLARQGLPLYEICAKLKITELTFRKYCETYKAFVQAWELGKSTHKDDFIFALEQELRKKTKSRKVTRRKKEYRMDDVIDPDSGEKQKKMVLYKETEEIEEREGDSLLIMYALKCLSPEKWRDNNMVSPESEDIVEQSKKLYRALLECETGLDIDSNQDAAQVATNTQPRIPQATTITEAEIVTS